MSTPSLPRCSLFESQERDRVRRRIYLDDADRVDVCSGGALLMLGASLDTPTGTIERQLGRRKTCKKLTFVDYNESYTETMTQIPRQPPL